MKLLKRKKKNTLTKQYDNLSPNAKSVLEVMRYIGHGYMRKTRSIVPFTILTQGQVDHALRELQAEGMVRYGWHTVE